MFTTLLAHSLAHTEGWRDGGPGPWALIPLTFFLFWLTVIVVAVVRFRRGGGPPWSRGGGQSVLDERYARGEIDVDEYRQRRAVLRERQR
jgi:putative membrane protein